MENRLYVNYLNRPKRAKYNADSEVILQQILQASMWNTCLSFQKKEAQPLSRKFLNGAEKSNLSIEMQFQTKLQSSNCSCVYRHLSCQQHCVKSNNNHVLRIPWKSKNSRFQRFQNCNGLLSRIGFKNMQDPFYYSIAHNKSSRQTFKNKYQHRFWPYDSFACKKNRDAKDENYHSSLHSNSLQLLPPSLYNAESLSINSHLQADDLCLCENLPLPSSGCIYQQDCICFLIRKSLSLFLVVTLSLKSTKNDSDKTITVHLPLKTTIESWCKSIKLKAEYKRGCCFYLNYPTHDNKRKYSYSYYYDKDGIEKESADLLVFNHKYEKAMHDFIKSHLVFKYSNDVVDPLHEKENASVGDFFDSLLTRYCCHPICSSHCSFKKEVLITNNSPLVQRISSRLQKKRNSGILSHLSDDFIVEVPVSKKRKKNRSAHPYSHQLFWNFYRKHKHSENQQWLSLAKTYHEHYNSTAACDLFEEINDYVPQFDISKVENCEVSGMALAKKLVDSLLESTIKESSRTCTYCGFSFENLSIQEKKFHTSRHTQPLWHGFQVPQFSLNKWPLKVRTPLEEERQNTKFSVDSPKKPLISEKTPSKEQVSRYNFFKRPTARKSHGAW